MFTSKFMSTQSTSPVADREGSNAASLPAVPVQQNKVIQKMGIEEEEPLQGKFVIQKQGLEEEELPPIQGKFAAAENVEKQSQAAGSFGSQISTVQKKANDTGLPDHLKEGVENLSGIAMDDVKVHYNSDQPAQLQALAYAQGTDIHVGPGQEKHLPHEAWHVVQQKQGRVQPTRQMKGSVAVNDDKGLENEADVMGEKAIQQKGVLSSKASLAQLKSVEKTVQLGRKKELKKLEENKNKRFIKLVLPGSGDLHWRTKTTDTQKAKMEPFPSDSGQLSWIKKMEDGNVEYTIAGPQALGGVSDTGANSIQNNINLGVELLTLELAYQRYLNKIKLEDIIILIKAHSRNAVAANQIAKFLKANFTDEEGFSPTIELVMLDPVPGPLHSGELLQTDISIIPDSTLVYSLITQFPFFFSPQKVIGASRLIISDQNHSVGTTSSFDFEGKIYQGSDLNSLPKGIFVGVGISENAEQNGMMVERIERLYTTEELIRKLYAAGAVTQGARIGIIKKVATYFGLSDNSPKM